MTVYLVCSSWSLPGAIWVPPFRNFSGVWNNATLSLRCRNRTRFFESLLQFIKLSTRSSWSSNKRSIATIIKMYLPLDFYVKKWKCTAFNSDTLPICKSGKCSTKAQSGSIWMWFLSARSRVTCPHVMLSSTNNDFEAPSVVNAFTNRRLIDACSNFCKAKWILAAFALSHY